MPKTTRNLNGQTMTQLAGKHDNLPAVMAFMRDEISQDMPHVKWKITPGVRRGGGDRAASIKAESEQTDDTAATVT